MPLARPCCDAGASRVVLAEGARRAVLVAARPLSSGEPGLVRYD